MCIRDRAQGVFDKGVILPGHQHLQVGGKLIEHLPAGAAGPAVIGAVAHHCQTGKGPAALTDGLDQGGALGAEGGAVSGVFHIAAGIYGPVRPLQRGAHGEAGVRNIGFFQHGEGQLHQSLIGHRTVSYTHLRAPRVAPATQ